MGKAKSSAGKGKSKPVAKATDVAWEAEHCEGGGMPTPVTATAGLFAMVNYLRERWDDEQGHESFADYVAYAKRRGAELRVVVHELTQCFVLLFRDSADGLEWAILLDSKGYWTKVRA